MQVFLVVAAILVTSFIAIFAGGALVGLASLGMHALRAVRKTQDVKVEVALSKPFVRPAGLHEAVKAETFADTGAAYAPA